MADVILTTCNGTITTLISSGDCILQCGMWLWNRDSEFTKWQHPAMWYVALGWHAIEFAQTHRHILHLVSISTHHRSRHVIVILYQSANVYPNRTTLGRKKWRHVDFQGGGFILICRDPIMFFFAFWQQTDRQTDKQMDKQMDIIDAWSCSFAIASCGLIINQ